MLILEDDLHVGKIIKMIAEASGMEVRLLTVPDSFLHDYEEWNPTHIALDLVMPDMDGVQVLAELASRHCTARIIITSGMGARVLDAAGRSGYEHGLNIVGVLAKPFSAAALRTLLQASPEDAVASDLGAVGGADAGAVEGAVGVADLAGAHAAAAVPGADIAGAAAPGARTAAPHQPHDRRRPGAQPFRPTESELRSAIGNGEFQLFYQPKIECATAHLAGFEALARWFHPQRGIVMPDQFIPLLDGYGLIDALTDAVLDQALAWFSQIRAAAAEVTLSINFSAKTFRDPAYLDRIVERCRRLKVSRESVIFELTESDSMDDPLMSLDLMTRLRMKGFALSIDDFGTGYSSLLQLVRLPFSEIKVDKSFVIAATRSTEARTVVKSIVDLGRSLGLKSAAEGVEDLQTLNFLKQIGCDLAQGFAIARPMDGAATREWLAARA